MEKLKKLLRNRWAANIAGCCSAVLLYLFLTHLSGPIAQWFRTLFRILSPIIIGIVIAYIIDPFVKKLESTLFRKIKSESLSRALSVVVAMVCAILIITLIIIMIIPAIGDSAKTLIDNADNYFASVKEFLSRFGIEIGSDGITNYINDMITQATTFLKENLGTVISRISGFGSTIGNIVIGIILAIYFLLDKQNMINGIKKLRRAIISDKNYESHTVFLVRCNDVFQQFIICTLVDSFIIGVANAVFMLIMRMPYIPLISVVMMLTNMIPSFGPLIGGVIGGVILLLVNPIQALIFIIYTVITQLLDANVLKPRIFKNSLGLPAVWTMIALILGGKLFNMIGILLAIPTMVVLRFVYTENFIPWLETRKERKEAAKAEKLLNS